MHKWVKGRREGEERRCEGKGRGQKRRVGKGRELPQNFRT